MIGTEEVWGILGGGFGLYGYLPAVAERTGGRIHTLVRYRETIRGRKDIQDYENRLAFEQDVKAVFARCNTVVIALRPADQESVLAGLLDQKWTGRLILEKPLARTPGAALSLLERLAGSGIVYRIGFTLGATGWFAQLTEYLATHGSETVSLDFQWRFLAHHYRCDVDTWKRHPAQGGGATRFFAIHLIALLASLRMDTPLNYSHTITPSGEEPDCRFAVSGSNRNATVSCDSHCQGEPGFSIRATAMGATALEIVLKDPFQEIAQNQLAPREQADVRIKYLRKILDSLDGAANDPAFYLRHVRLWSRLEASMESPEGVIPR